MNTNTALPVEIRNVVIATTLASLAARVGSVQEMHAACRRAVKAVTGASRVARGDGGLIDALCDEVRANPESFSTASASIATPVNVNVDMSATNGLLAQIIALLQTLLTVCVKGFASGNQLPGASEKVIDAEFLLPEAKAVPVTSDVKWVQVLPEATRLPALPAASSKALALRN